MSGDEMIPPVDENPNVFRLVARVLDDISDGLVWVLRRIGGWATW